MRGPKHRLGHCAWGIANNNDTTPAGPSLFAHPTTRTVTAATLSPIPSFPTPSPPTPPPLTVQPGTEAPADQDGGPHLPRIVEDGLAGPRTDGPGGQDLLARGALGEARVGAADLSLDAQVQRHHVSCGAGQRGRWVRAVGGRGCGGGGGSGSGRGRAGLGGLAREPARGRCLLMNEQGWESDVRDGGHDGWGPPAPCWQVGV